MKGAGTQASFWLTLHLSAMVAWLGPGTVLAWWIVFGIEDMKWAAFTILLVSNYANFVSHWGAWQAARAERQAGSNGK